MDDDTNIHARLDDVRERVAAAAAQSGRAEEDVQILLATKTQPARRIRSAIDHGFTLIGENRVQELLSKAPELADLEHRAHMIGPLQKNKVAKVCDIATSIDSIDSVALAHKIQRRLETIDSTMGVMVQVNTSREDSKSGVSPEDARPLVEEVLGCDRLRLRGLMTIGFPGATESEIRPSYARLRELRDSLYEAGVLDADMCGLSMGMSGDYPLAIAEGATEIRIGSSVFGTRD